MEELFGTKTLPAIISALVAIALFFLSQWFLSRRNSIELRTQKLEELYLAVNDLSNKHAVRFELVRSITQGDRSILEDPEHTHKLYLLDINKQILMFVRLYFPELEATHIELFHGNREITNKIYNLLEHGRIEQEDFIATFVSFGDHLRAMEDEIINNKKRLVGESIIPTKHKRSSHNKSSQQDASEAGASA
ncbi:hypothetical protein [Shewanella algae]|uniref:hypothetical protein n=1 Tax=Shewanella algae TaxID=38313 RepID=UPI001AAD7BED|nr:hypothetical protein [Shewanella algae]MBO2701881.1 hypothetical protein [Shewanella algae]